MKLDKNSHTPLYVQLKELIKNKILSGVLKPGDFTQTEAHLCEEYGLSRYPVRQALGELVDEGYLQRIRGRGTIISPTLPQIANNNDNLRLGLVLNSLSDEFNLKILSGFEKESRTRGYLTITCCTENAPSEEQKCMDKMLNERPNGVFLFSCDDSQVKERKDEFEEKNINLGLLDRNPGLEDVNYVGSDNFGGGYTATRHLAEQGFENFVFISSMQNLSSINERMEGYLKALDDFDLKPIPHIHIDEDISGYNKYKEKFFVEKLDQQLNHLKNYLPLGVFAVNDAIALYCLKVFKANDFNIGKDVGIVGFDNIMQTQYSNPPLTTVAQNGFLMGQSAAKILIDKTEGNKQIHKSIIPTQLIVRSSCGER